MKIKYLIAVILIISAGFFYKNYFAYPTTEEMVGQMILAGFRGTGEENPENIDITVLKEDIKAGRIGGIILFNKDAQTMETTRNIVSKEQLKKLIKSFQKNAKIPLFVSVDQEGGIVRRILPEHGFQDYVSHKELGKGNSQNTYKMAKEMGKELKEVGFNVDFAPDVDLEINKDNPIIAKKERSFSDDAELVAEHAKAFSNGLKDAGIIYSFKHFPGHGSSKDDTHLGIVDITKTWDEKELIPYEKLIYSDMQGMVMIGHMILGQIDDKYPASISKKVITGLLREKMNYDGVVITDDIQMEAISKYYGLKETYKMAIDAGVDILLIGNNLNHDTYNARQAYNIVLDMVKSGEISKERIKESYKRIMKLKKMMR